MDVMSVPAIVLGQTIYKLVYGERRWIAARNADTPTCADCERRTLRRLKSRLTKTTSALILDIFDRARSYAHLFAQYMLDHRGEKGFTEEKCYDLIAQTRKNDKIKGRTVQQIIALLKLT